MKIYAWMLCTLIGIIVSCVFFVVGFVFRYAKGGFCSGIGFAEKDAKDIFKDVA